jgi:hypothetical protein
MMKVVLKHLNDPAALAAVAETFPAFAIKKDDLKRLHIPVCSIIGTKDPLKYNADALVGVAPDLHRTILIGANHINAPMRRDFTATLLEFLRENSKGLAAK